MKETKEQRRQKERKKRGPRERQEKGGNRKVKRVKGRERGSIYVVTRVEAGREGRTERKKILNKSFI